MRVLPLGVDRYGFATPASSIYIWALRADRIKFSCINFDKLRQHYVLWSDAKKSSILASCQWKSDSREIYFCRKYFEQRILCSRNIYISTITSTIAWGDKISVWNTESGTFVENVQGQNSAIYTISFKHFCVRFIVRRIEMRGKSRSGRKGRDETNFIVRNEVNSPIRISTRHTLENESRISGRSPGTPRSRSQFHISVKN